MNPRTSLTRSTPLAGEPLQPLEYNSKRLKYHNIDLSLLSINFTNILFFVYYYLKITSLQSVLYLSVSVLPLPGTVGVNETGFSLLYNPIIAKNIVDSAMLLTRGVGFYLYVIITGIILLVISLRKKQH